MRVAHARRRLRDHGARSPYLPADRRKKRQWLYGYGHAVIGPQYYALADVLVAPSLLEAFGLPAVEAAEAVPVVASATGGLLDTVVPGQTGLLVPPGDAAALARAIEVVVANRGRGCAWPRWPRARRDELHVGRDRGHARGILREPAREADEESRRDSRVARGRRACGVLIADQNRKVVPARTSSGVPIFVIPPPMLGEALARPSGTRT